MPAAVVPMPSGLLGDTKERDYAHKLSRFNRFAAPELRRAMESLHLQPGMSVLDAGCGTGEALRWLHDAVGTQGAVLGIDLSTAHLALARAQAPTDVGVIQADVTMLPLQAGSFDLIWTVNTLNHLHDPIAGLSALLALLRPGGRVAWGQSSFLPDMYFAWDARLERVTNEAVRRYYRDRYGLDERDLTGVRALVGMLREAGLNDVRAQTFSIDRVSPLAASDEDYLLETLFRGTWGPRLQPYLSEDDYAELLRLCDPHDARFALARPDFHFLQTFTLVVGGV
jgi:ubiquinone/menaquinone biosynthesis C-methylase UbiE